MLKELIERAGELVEFGPVDKPGKPGKPAKPARLREGYGPGFQRPSYAAVEEARARNKRARAARRAQRRRR